MKIILGFFAIVFACFGDLIAADINAIKAHVQNTKIINASTRAVMDGGALHMTDYRYIAPDFIKAVLESPEGSQTLDAGAGQGFVLQSLFEQGNWPNFPVNYTAVEKKSSNMSKIKQVFESNKLRLKKENKTINLGVSTKDIFLFLDNKKEKYDHIFAGFLLNTMHPAKYTELIDLFFLSMKEDAHVYITQNSYTLFDKMLEDYPSEYYDQINSGDILPFWSMVAKPWSKVFFSDPETMKALMESFGFEVVSSGLYQNIFFGIIDGIAQARLTPYMGMIAKKNSALRDENKIKRYKERAQEIEHEWGPKH